MYKNNKMQFIIETEIQKKFIINNELEYPLISEIKKLNWNENGYIIIKPMNNICEVNFLQIEIRSLNITYGIEINFKCNESYVQYQFTTTDIDIAISICSEFFYKHKIPDFKNWKYINKEIILENYERDKEEYSNKEEDQ